MSDKRRDFEHMLVAVLHCPQCGGELNRTEPTPQAGKCPSARCGACSLKFIITNPSVVDFDKVTNGKLSAAMIEAAEWAKQHGGGKLNRYPGGYWRAGTDQRSYGTTTVEALVKRGAAKYTAHQTGRFGSFPIEITVL